jgi:hypothetical protein
MSRKYKYLFRFGHGAKTLELLGPSITYFWNDIYDSFDLHREMFVEKWGDGAFSISEIKRLFGELSEDMEEDFAEIWLEIQNQGKRLRFLEVNILPGFELDEQEELLREYSSFLEKPQTILSTNQHRILFFAEEITIVMFAYPADFKKPLNTTTVKLLLDYARERSANRMILITWGDVNSDAKSLAETSKIELMDTEKMLQEINKKNLEIAIDEFRMNMQGDLETKFSKERFKVYLDLVKNASSNMAKKDSLEDLSKYFLNGIKGLKVIDKNYRGPSEEFDLGNLLLLVLRWEY